MTFPPVVALTARPNSSMMVRGKEGNGERVEAQRPSDPAQGPACPCLGTNQATRRGDRRAAICPDPACGCGRAARRNIDSTTSACSTSERRSSGRSKRPTTRLQPMSTFGRCPTRCSTGRGERRKRAGCDREPGSTQSPHEVAHHEGDSDRTDRDHEPSSRARPRLPPPRISIRPGSGSPGGGCGAGEGSGLGAGSGFIGPGGGGSGVVVMTGFSPCPSVRKRRGRSGHTSAMKGRA